ncbi:hypothetical protein SAMN04515665_11737 [Blastococcus sp. DSM 46786]|uniref:hypothetical protein n=1 Tax=Blastococcus sp. DSM 46786 TaxID=1798227 RepID=UPI0008CB2108|nr:hypothetical protein [Blastococcus sp. DSM 46786]SEL69292.1 hypothetical protein SAMN04515665_11737 [Blastococcus sp. DSM 46786]
METSSDRTPSPQEARDALAQLARDEDAVRYPPIPRWFFLVGAAVVAGVTLAQLLPPRTAGIVVLPLVVLMALLAHRYWFNTDGVSGASVKVGDMAAYLTVFLGTFGIGWLVEATTDAWWIWFPCAAVTATTVLVTGERYVREFGHAR